MFTHVNRLILMHNISLQVLCYMYMSNRLTRWRVIVVLWGMEGVVATTRRACRDYRQVWSCDQQWQNYTHRHACIGHTYMYMRCTCQGLQRLWQARTSPTEKLMPWVVCTRW